MKRYKNIENLNNSRVIQKNFKFRLYPIRKQERRLEKCLDQACFLHNQLLDIHQQIYLGEKETLTQFDVNNLLKSFETPNLHSQVKQNIPKRINGAFNHFFRRVKNGKEAKGFPRFKKRAFYKSITFSQYQQEMYNDRSYISKVGMIKIKKHREIEGQIKTLTIKKEGNERYAVFSCENVPIKEQETEFESEVQGIDVGLNKFVVCSDGREFDNPRFLRKAEDRIKRFQRRLSKKERGSRNRRKARIKISRHHTKISRQRDDFHKKLARNLASEIRYIGIEDLNIEGIVKNHYLAKSISGVGQGGFFSYLKYYKTIFEGEIIEIGRFEPTSQTFSNCGHRQDISLGNRVFECSSCGLLIDRDLNASVNVKKLTIKKLNNTEGHSEFQACGDTIRPLEIKASVVEAGSYRESV